MRKLKRIIIVLACCMFLNSPIQIIAASSVTGSNYTLTSDYVLTVFGAGTSVTGSDGWKHYQSQIRHVVFDAYMLWISERAFQNYSSLETVTFENIPTMVDMGCFAFYQCKKLKSVELPNCLTEIKQGTFAECTSLKSIEIPNSVTKIGVGAFEECTSLKSIEIPNSVTEMEGSVFCGCTGLTSIQIPSKITEIDGFTFRLCTNLQSIELPDSITSIGMCAFEGCSSLNSIELPDNITDIATCAFYRCTGLESIKIPSGVTNISSGAFWECTNLTSVEISDSVTEIGSSAFRDCINLKDIYYSGTKEQWNEITIGENFNEALTSATIHFNYQSSDDEDSDVTTVFNDVSSSDWFVDSIQFVYDKGMMSGNAGAFNPNEEMTRAMIVTTLYRLAGEPEVTDYMALSMFSDVYADMWYTNAVCWAYNTGVTTGYPDRGMFGTDDSVTREQLATFLYRYADNRGLSTTERGDLSTLLNADKVNSYAEDAIRWAVGIGLISGLEFTQNGVKVYDLAPQNTATRAQMATILMRFCNYYKI